MNSFRVMISSALFMVFCLYALPLAAENETECPVIVIDNIVVYADRLKPEVEKLDRDALESGRFTSAGEAINELPGVSAVRRSASGVEPVIRGLGWERVVTQVNNVPTYGACPSRMDPPITYVKPHLTDDIQVIKGVPSVTLGPPGTGGKIIINTDYERPDGSPDTFGQWARLGYHGSRNGFSGEAGVLGGNKWMDFRGAVEALDYNDYTSAHGIEVPANQDGRSTSVSLGFRPRPDHRWWNSFSYVREEDIDYPSLPMNLDKTDYLIYNTGYRIKPATGILTRFDVNFGVQDVDHLMSNRGKSNRATVENETPSDAASYSGSAKGTIQLSPHMALCTGADYANLSRNAVRTRLTVASAEIFFDHLWPDASQWDLGGFAELTAHLTESLLLRTGIRADRVDSSADDADSPSLQKKTVRENFIRFYGPDAGDVNHGETLGSGNVLLEWFLSEELALHAGCGISTRAPGVTERYFAFAPAPGGYVVGNPDLDSEKKYELDAGVSRTGDTYRFSLSAYHSRIQDYILQTTIGMEDVNKDGISDIIKGFGNIDARVYGLESSLILTPFADWTFPATIACVRGENTSNNRDLPEIPPLEATVSAIYSSGGHTPWWAELGTRMALRQNKIDETFPENKTAGFSVFHVRAGITLKTKYKISAGIENLFDREYHEHLTRETLLATDDLKAGDEVPEPGRSFYLSCRVDF